MHDIRANRNWQDYPENVGVRWLIQETYLGHWKIIIG
jgi:hypothetical protein